MSNVVIARRYAAAFFEIACAENSVERFQDELSAFVSACELQPDLLLVLAAEEIPATKRNAIVTSLGAALKISDVTVNFLKLLVDKRRIKTLLEIKDAYVVLAANAAGVVTAFVTTAAPVLDAEIFSQIERTVGKLMNKKVRIESNVNPEIIGGVTLRIGDKIFDGSISAELQRVREQLKQAV